MTVVFADKAKKEFLKLGKTAQQQIKKFVLKLKKIQNPRSTGKALTGNLGGLWRYRVGDYRLICEINDDEILVTVLKVAHRKEVYTR